MQSWAANLSVTGSLKHDSNMMESDCANCCQWVGRLGSELHIGPQDPGSWFIHLQNAQPVWDWLWFSLLAAENWGEAWTGSPLESEPELE